MPSIPTRTHGAADYATAAAFITIPRLLGGKDARATRTLRLAGAGTLLTSALTDYELGVRRLLPMPVHLMIDAATGSLLTVTGLKLRRRAGFGVLLRFVMLGSGEIAAAALTSRTPSDREESFPGAASGVSSSGPAAATTASSGPPLATPPVETPGPSVTPPAEPESDVERAERVEDTLPEPAGATGDALAAREEAAAAAEAAMIGGPHHSETGDPAMDPVYEAGGGEQDGWDAAERDLIENATHGEGGGNPERDALTPELEADRSTAVYGEGDQIPSTEVVEDPAIQPGADDPGEGPGLSAERGPSEIPEEKAPTTEGPAEKSPTTEGSAEKSPTTEVPAEKAPPTEVPEEESPTPEVPEEERPDSA
jgi:hypothetical protein